MGRTDGRRFRRPGLLTTSISALLMVSACGGARTEAGGRDGADADTGPEPDITVSCGSVVFDSIPPDPDAFPPIDADAQEAVDELFGGETGLEARSFLDGYTWSIASRTDEALILLGRPEPGSPAALEVAAGGPPYADASFERVDGSWRPSGFGQCQLEVSAEGLGPATLMLDLDREPDPASPELPVLINEQACAGGQPPVDREIVPVVHETETTVEITVLVAPVEGAAECPSNPWYPITVTLDAPLGDRPVFDASAQPPEERSWPPAPEDLDR